MRTHFRSMPLATAFIAILLTFVACSDDDDPADGGTADSTPPSLTSITAIDARHIDVVFSEALNRASAEDYDNYTIVETVILLSAGDAAAPGDTLLIEAASLKTDQKTVSLTVAPMQAVPYDMSIAGVRDTHGNAISTPVADSFTGTTDADVTPPQLVSRSPAPNATGVPIATSLLLTFTERITYDSFVNGLEWTSGAGTVPFEALSDDEGVHIEAVPQITLEMGTQYTVTLTGLQDEAGNVLPTTSWSFTTTNTADNTPPTVVSSVPANGATNVDMDANLSITFSEAINASMVEAGTYPNVGDGDQTMSNGGKTLTFDPFVSLLPDQQYTVTILPGGVQDLNGNGNTSVVTIRFTTGSTLATGSIRGTLSGDPGSDYAGDPTGALVLAVEGSLMNLEGGSFGGTAIAAGNNTYDIRNLVDGTFVPFAILDSNDDGEVNPSSGDAVGALGVDLSIGDFDEETVVISGGNVVSGASFPIYDISAITGTVSYSGAYANQFHQIGIGLFEVVGFDPNGDPDYGHTGFWPDFIQWEFLNIEDAFPDGSYYVGAFLDVNDNGMYDPAVDPAGFYGGDPPTAIVINNGKDANDIVIPMIDPLVPLRGSAVSVAWPKPVAPKTDLIRRLTELARRASAEPSWKAGSSR